MFCDGLQSGLQAGNLLGFSVGEGGLCFANGKMERADLHYLGRPNRARAFADSFSKVRRHFNLNKADIEISSRFKKNNPKNVEERTDVPKGK